MGADHHLLFGLLALQTGLIQQAQLVAAFHAWTGDKARPLAEHLVALGYLTAAQRPVIEALAVMHLGAHGGDAEQSLAAIPAGPSTRESLAALGDPEIERTLTHIGLTTQNDPNRTVSQAVDTATKDGMRFRVLRPHARGGLGAVFVALDSELNREVALKQILHEHADNPDSRRRFLLEAEITGGLEHPGIVPVYGLGTYEGGRPYYAMRFIQGDSLREAIGRFHGDAAVKADPGRRSLELRKLLRRFVDVCNAIDYAHARGVLHRDIKPANIIVGKYGETLVVDWGLAKPLGNSESSSDIDERTLIPSEGIGLADTLPGSALGTPAYMSPEQAAGQLDRLGIRSDVYSLGATLYCLLTGKAPFAGDGFEVLRKVERGEFTAPRQLEASIDPALEAVCLKAMERQPEARYATCRALADDVERWTADEPVTAYRDPLGRRARRWARRNRTVVASAAAALVAGVLGLSALAAEQARSNVALSDAHKKTQDALVDTRKAQAATKVALEQSEASRQQAEAVGRFLVDALKKPDSDVAGKDVKVADVLDQAAAGLDRGFDGSKATEAALREALGRSYFGLGLYPKAEEAHRKARGLREAALGPEHRDTLRSRTELGRTYHNAGRDVEAIALHEATRRLFESNFGPDDPDTLESCDNLAVAYWAAGRHAEAIPLHQATLRLREAKLGPDHPDTLNSRNNLALAYKSSGRISDAIAMNVVTLRLREAKLGPDHTETLASRYNLAASYADTGRTAEAVPLFEATLNLCESRFGPDHPYTLHVRNGLAVAYRDVGRNAAAIPLFEATLTLRKSKLGPDHPDTIVSRLNLAIAYRTVGRTADAIAMVEEAVRVEESRLGPDHPTSLADRNILALTYGAAGRWADAEATARETVARRRRTEKPDSTGLASALAILGHNLLKQSKWSEAEPLLRESLAIFVKANPADYLRFRSASLLGGALLGQKRYAEAETQVVGGYEGMKAHEAMISPNTKFFLSEAEERLVRLYKDWGKPDQAAAWASKLGRADLPADVFAPR